MQAVEIPSGGSPIREEAFAHIVLGHHGSRVQCHGGHERVSIVAQLCPCLDMNELAQFDNILVVVRSLKGSLEMIKVDVQAIKERE